MHNPRRTLRQAPHEELHEAHDRCGKKRTDKKDGSDLPTLLWVHAIHSHRESSEEKGDAYQYCNPHYHIHGIMTFTVTGSSECDQGAALESPQARQGETS